MPFGQEASNSITSTSYYAVVEAELAYRTGLSTHDAFYLLTQEAQKT